MKNGFFVVAAKRKARENERSGKTEEALASGQKTIAINDDRSAGLSTRNYVQCLSDDHRSNDQVTSSRGTVCHANLNVLV